MKAQYKAKPFPGPRAYQQRAVVALPLLVRQAFTQEVITYGHLAAEMGMPNPKNLNYVLGSIGNTLKELGKEWPEEIPPIQALVVNKKSGLPGSGGRWFVDGNWEKLEPNALKQTIRQSLSKIFNYPRWRDLLRHFQLPEVEERFDSLLKSAATSGRGDGESEEHKALKNEVCLNPSLARVPFRAAGHTEYPVPSGDRIDVCFWDEKNFAAVEVKPLSASEADIVRGLYQCIKYDAVLRKWLAFRRSNEAVSVVLLLAGKLPARLLALKNALGVRVVELKRPA